MKETIVWLSRANDAHARPVAKTANRFPDRDACSDGPQPGEVFIPVVTVPSLNEQGKLKRQGRGEHAQASA